MNYVPYVYVTPVMLTFMLLVCGTQMGIIALFARDTITVIAFLVLVSPAVVRLLGADSSQLMDPRGLIYSQPTPLAGFLADVSILLDRFHRSSLEMPAHKCAVIRDRQSLEREIAAVRDQERHRGGDELRDGLCQQVTVSFPLSRTLFQTALSQGTQPVILVVSQTEPL